MLTLVIFTKDPLLEKESFKFCRVIIMKVNSTTMRFLDKVQCPTEMAISITEVG